MPSLGTSTLPLTYATLGLNVCIVFYSRRVLLQLCPLFPHDQDTFNCLLSPAMVMSFKDKDNMKNVEVN